MNVGLRTGAWANGLPYDRKVNWVGATGTQWADTGITSVPSYKTTFSLIYTKASQSANPILACRYGSLLRIFPLFFWNDCLDPALGGDAIDSSALTEGYEYGGFVQSVSYNSDAIINIGGETRSVSHIAAEDPSALNSLPLYLFAVNYNGSIPYYGNGKIKKLTLQAPYTSDPVMDLIPVVRNSVGCFYDKVRKILIYSKTDPFIWG